jgi:hypothetical protein
MILVKHSQAKFASSSRKSESYEMSGVRYNSTFPIKFSLYSTPFNHTSPLPVRSEIAELMAVKAKHSAGGEYSPDWRPKVIYPDLQYRWLPMLIMHILPCSTSPTS